MIIPEQRFCILGDDSGHDYFIPVDRQDDFYRWVEIVEAGEQYYGQSFEPNRIDGRFTFTDPRCG